MLPTDPQQMIAQMFGNNPNYNRAMQMVQGKSPEQIQQTVINLARNRGVSMDMLKQFANQHGFRF